MPHITESDLHDTHETFLTDRGLASLYIQYPEMLENDIQNTAHDQLPEPNQLLLNLEDEDDEDEEEAESTILSSSTTRTTPLRNEPLAVTGVARTSNEFTAFFQKVETSGLVEKSAQYFRVLGATVLQLGRTLFPISGVMTVATEDIEKMVNLGLDMSSMLRASNQRVNEQIENIAYILTLAPFTVAPAPDDLFSNYLQMSELILK